MANETARKLRRNRTTAEQTLWPQLRQLKQQGFKFRQQAPIDGFIVDFICLSQRLIVEVDGGTHSTVDECERDAKRETHLREQGFHIIRFWNGDVMENIEGVMDSIVAELSAPHPRPLPARGRGEERTTGLDVIELGVQHVRGK